ncbi:MAG: C4-dicarboxylate ABC transporter substrate-binding protein [Gammaproteobacteria bacterium]|nr:C4-dicarboxylate ABC transporter substrate-binding protein [Gammaproteobacteria bacterium]
MRSKIAFSSASRNVPWAALLLFWMLVPAALAEPVTLRVQHFLGTDSLPHRALIEPWARRVEGDSAGRLRIEIHPAMTLGGTAPELIDQVQQGTVDIVWTAAAYTPGRFPRSEVFALPLVHTGNPVATNLAIMQLIQRELSPDFTGLKPLLIHVDQGHAFHLSNRSVARVSQFVGLTLRPPGKGIGSWTITALGAENTKKRHPKLPKAMRQGELDGALMTFTLAESMGVTEASQSHTLLDQKEFFGTSLFLFVMNDARFRALPADLRTVIERNSGPEFAREIGDIYQQAGDAAITAAERRGNRINLLQGAELEQARSRLATVVARWRDERTALSIDGAALIAAARSAIASHSGE